MVLEILGGVYRIPLKLSGHCNKVGKREKGIRGPMARPQDFAPKKDFIGEDEAEARTLQKIRTQKDPMEALSTCYGVQAALSTGNIAAVENFADIQANKMRATDFIKKERLNRERDIRI